MEQNKQSSSLAEAFEQGAKYFVEECTLCGQCLEACPSFNDPKLELNDKNPAEVMEKIVDLLKGGPSSEEAYKMGYGCLMGCTNICKPACPKDLNMQQAFMVAGQRLRAAGEGLPPLSFMHLAEHRYNFGHVFGDLQMKKSEVPWLTEVPSEQAAVDVVIFTSCVGRGFPNLVLEAMDILSSMKINFAVIGARDLCCGGTPLLLGNMKDVSRVSEKYISTMAKFGAGKVVAMCPACSVVGNDMLSKFSRVPFETIHITEFLADNIDKLHFTHPLNKRVTIHDACSQRQRGSWDIPRKLLEAIPGLTLVEMEHSRENSLCCGAQANANFPGLMIERNIARLNEAMAVRADIMTTICPGCQLAFCGYENQYPFEIKHAISLVAEAMGIHHEDKVKKYLLTGDPEKVLEEASEYVEASDLSLLEYQQILPRYFQTLCVSRGFPPS
ncbi:MAG: (Fe-S)-binding protein [Desulfobacterium sp.]|nr:(Fe-S)-binding protein [Desulfobacterium sp.]MBU3948056.1 (Fe-S)-binding protein [Pseudomonadota bacterium]